MQNGGVIPNSSTNASTNHHVTATPLDGRTSPRGNVTNGNGSSDFVVINGFGDEQIVHSDGEHKQINTTANNSTPVAKTRIGHVNRSSKSVDNGVGEFKVQVNRTVQKLPPMQTKGRHKCPRCARRFVDSAECSDHKARCIS